MRRRTGSAPRDRSGILAPRSRVCMVRSVTRVVVLAALTAPGCAILDGLQTAAVGLDDGGAADAARSLDAGGTDGGRDHDASELVDATATTDAGQIADALPLYDAGFGCGNGIVEIGAGEECDDGNEDESDECTSACKLTCTLFEAVTTNWYHLVAISRSGRLWAWGANRHGECGDGPRNDRASPDLVLRQSPAGARWTSLAAGNKHTLALRADGTVWGFGVNDSGQLATTAGLGAALPLEPFQLLLGFAATKVAVGADSSFAIDDQERLWAWGLNDQGQLGLDSLTPTHVPTRVTFPSDGVRIQQVSSLGALVVALDGDGNVWAWGANAHLQAGGPAGQAFVRAPRLIGELGEPAITDVAAGRQHALALDESGRVWAWGDNSGGRLGVSTSSVTRSRSPIHVSLTTRIRAIGAGNTSSFAIDTVGDLWSWGGNGVGALGHGTMTSTSVPTMVTTPPSARWDTVKGAYHHAAGLHEDGTVWVWGSSGRGQLGAGSLSGRALVPGQVVACP